MNKEQARSYFTGSVCSCNLHRSRVRRSLRTLQSAALLACLGCQGVQSLSGVSSVSTPERMSPPEAFAGFWKQVEQCSGLQGPFHDVKWYRARAVTTPHGTADALWISRGPSVVLGPIAQTSPGVIRHEMLHALRRTGDHARSPFLRECAGVVSCDENCIRDAGPPPLPPAAREPPPDALGVEVTSAVVGDDPRLGGYWVTCTVEVTNRSNQWLTSAAEVREAGGRTFALEIAGSSWRLVRGGILRDSASLTWAPGEVKRMMFDFVVGGSSSEAIPRDTYRLLPRYAGRRGIEREVRFD